MNPSAQNLIAALEAAQQPTKARWWENYVKHGIQSLGVPMAEIRRLLKVHQPSSPQRDFADALMSQVYMEHKLAAVLYLQLAGKDWPSETALDWIEHWFDQAWIYDWCVCDWLCVKVLSPRLDGAEDALVLDRLAAWGQADYLWKARAALVPFTLAKSLPAKTAHWLPLAQTLIQRPERFAKTAVGWVLREYSRHEPQAVLDFLQTWQAQSNKEVERNALEYIRKGKK